MNCHQTLKDFRCAHPRKFSGKPFEDRRILEDSIKTDILYFSRNGHEVKNYFCNDSVSIVIKLRAGGAENCLVAAIFSTLVVVPSNPLSNSYCRLYLYLWNKAFEPFT